MIDLHSHSSASDGNMSPSEAALYAVNKGLTVWALTDHDTVDGLKEAAEVCYHHNITFVPGIEINIQWPTGEFHLLGHGITHVSDELNDVITYLKDDRKNRNLQIIDRMANDGVKVTLEQLEQRFNTKQIGRPHFAQFLVEAGVVKKRQDAFDKYLAKGRAWYIGHAGENLEVAVDAIKKSGGVPVLAHPLSLYVSWGKIEGVITSIRDMGVEGLEAWHPGAREGEARRLEILAHNLGMFVTAGSDFHGEGVRADRRLGRTSGGNKINERFWTEELKPRLGDFDITKTQWLS